MEDIPGLKKRDTLYCKGSEGISDGVEEGGGGGDKGIVEKLAID